MDHLASGEAVTPQRIQRRRTKGWRLPAGAIIVTRPTKWGNPFKPTNRDSHQLAVTLYERWLALIPEGREIAEAAKRELRGHDLACFCKLDQPCHADVLLRIANEEN